MPNPARRIGVCSWSLQASTPRELVERIKETGQDAVQLALDPIRSGSWDERETVAVLRDAGITILSGMMAPAGEDYSTLDTIRETGGVRLDEHWETNLAAAKRNAELASRLGLSLCTFHAGFIPDDPDSELHDVMVDRLRAVVDAFADQGVRIGFETGQESAETLLEALDEIDRPTLGVNFDPANMILYGMGEPVHAIELLAPRVMQIHIKDAIPAERPGQWGTEMRAGDGAVDWEKFFGVVGGCCPDVSLVIEREGGDARVADIRAARDMLDRLGAG